MRMLLSAVLAASVSSGPAQQPPPVAAPPPLSCAQAQPIVDRLLAAATARVEAARLTNTAAEMRVAVEALQSLVRDVRTTLAPCATLKVEDPHAGHLGQPAAAVPPAPADPHAGHDAVAPAATASGEILRWLEAYDAAFVAKDLARLEAFYHPEVTVYEGTGVDDGWANYRDSHLGPELRSFEGLEYGHRSVMVYPLGEHAAYVTAQVFLKAQASGKPLDLMGRETLVLEHTGGAWKIRHQQIAVRAVK